MLEIARTPNESQYAGIYGTQKRVRDTGGDRTKTILSVPRQTRLLH